MSNYDWMDEKQSGTGPPLDIQTGEAGGKSEAPPTPSDYCLELDQWGQRRGRDLHQFGDFFNLGIGEQAVADMYGMAFEREPAILEHCADETRLQFINALNETPEYHALHTKTELDVVASEMAALRFSREYATFKQKRDQEQKKKPPKGKPTPGQGTAGGAAKASVREKLRQEMQAIAAAGRATELANQDVNELNEMRESMGIGSGDGPGGNINPEAMKQTFHRIKNNQVLQEIIEKAGRFRLLARSKQREKLSHGYDDMIGVTLGDNLTHLLPNELAALAHPVLKLDALRRLVEKQMMQREYEGVEKVAKGPIMVLIDESSSMNGPRITNAKALGLTMAWVAKHQKRWCALVGWSSANQQRYIVLPPNRWPAPTVFMDWLQFQFGGGTYLPLHKIPEIYRACGASKGKTDLIIITDGDTSPVGKDVEDRFRQWQKESQARIIGISIASHARGLKEISDEFYMINELSINSEAVAKAVSV